ncbi:MAG: hypothetical protein GMKNLPBB_01036 [Myxococcota bacterium]|nr:hypothetical protein [Myxococcota bacterium]
MRELLISLLALAAWTAPLAAIAGDADNPAPAAAPKAQTVKASGTAAVPGGKSASKAARNNAIEKATFNALRSAVEQTVGVLIDSESRTENFQLIDDRILSKSKGYVSSFKVLETKDEGEEVSVTVEAVVEAGKVKTTLGSILHQLERQDMPRVMILIAEQMIGQTEPNMWWSNKDNAKPGTVTATDLGAAENILVDLLSKKGFRFVDRQALSGKISVSDPASLLSDSKRVQEIANLTDAQLIIVGKAVVKEHGAVDPNSTMRSCMADYSLRVIKAGNGEIVATVNANGTFLAVNPTTAGVKALEKAGKRAADELIGKMLESWRKEATGPRTIAMKIKGVNDFSTFLRLKTWMTSELEGVKAVRHRQTSNGVSVADVEYNGPADQLAAALAETPFESKALKVVDINAAGVTVEIPSK